jgi:archaellum component FlaG (FlaF/FlaG flagellin family)
MILGIFYKEVTTAYTNYATLEFLSATSSISGEVANAKWEIVFTVKNTGTEDILLEDLAVNNILIKDYDLSPGDSLFDVYSTGTNLPEEAYILRPGETLFGNIWVGNGLFSSGTTINIQILNVNSVDVAFSVVLV